MGNFYCTLTLVLLLCTCMIVLGFVDIFKKDQAWRISKWMMRNVRPQRTPEWERTITFNGVILLGFGLVWLFSILYVLFK